MLASHDFVSNQHICHSYFYASSLAKGYDPLYSSSPLASLDGFSRSHGDSLYVMQLVVAATNQNALYNVPTKTSFPSIIAVIYLLWLSVNEFILNFSQIFAWKSVILYLESIFRAFKRKEMKASRRFAENDITTRGVTVKIQQVAVRGNYENPSNDAKGEDE